MAKKAYDDKLAAIAALRKLAPEEAAPALKKALGDRNNYLVSRAALVAGEMGIDALVPELLAAYARFFEDGSDQQCWAKIETLTALKTLGHRDPATYLRGLRHVQLEGVYGGHQDAAAPLRSKCALALIDCPMPSLTILRHLTPLLADDEATVRADAVRAVAHLGDPAGVLLLRLKALCGDAAPEVLGHCFSALLALEPGSDGVTFVAGFLQPAGRGGGPHAALRAALGETQEADVQLEAACALAQSADREAFAAVERYWNSPGPSPEMRRAILLNLGASPLKEAAALLREVIETNPRLSDTARQALEASRFK